MTFYSFMFVLVLVLNGGFVACCCVWINPRIASEIKTKIKWSHRHNGKSVKKKQRRLTFHVGHVRMGFVMMWKFIILFFFVPFSLSHPFHHINSLIPVPLHRRLLNEILLSTGDLEKNFDKENFYHSVKNIIYCSCYLLLFELTWHLHDYRFQWPFHHILPSMNISPDALNSFVENQE